MPCQVSYLCFIQNMYQHRGLSGQLHQTSLPCCGIWPMAHDLLAPKATREHGQVPNKKSTILLVGIHTEKWDMSTFGTLAHRQRMQLCKSLKCLLQPLRFWFTRFSFSRGCFLGCKRTQTLSADRRYRTLDTFAWSSVGHISAENDQSIHFNRRIH